MNQIIGTFISQRWVTTLLCFFGLLNAYAMRIILSIAITEMVVPLNETTASVDETCPRNDEDAVRKPKSTVNMELYDWSEYTQVQ